MYFLKVKTESYRSFIVRKQHSKSKEIRILGELLEYFQENANRQINSIQSLAMQFQCIKNPQILNLLKYFIAKKYINKISPASIVKASSEIVNLVEKNSRKFNFHQQVNINLYLMRFMQRFTDIEKYSLYIQSILNCNTIFNSLKIENFPHS